MIEVIARIQNALREAANSEKAKQMQAYQKTTQPFFGVQAPQVRQIFREAVKAHPVKDRETWEKIILELWRAPHREEMYMALNFAERYTAFRDEKAWPLFELMVRSATNWDTLDFIASTLVGDLVHRFRHFEEKLIAWRTDANFWVRRASVLAHLKHKTDTNTKLLGESILVLAHEKEFFIQKAIGWVLREYAKTNADWVKTFVEKNQDQLAALSKREALKHFRKG